MIRFFLRKGLPLLMVLVIFLAVSVGIMPTISFADGTRSTQNEEILAGQLKTFGLFSGVGTNPDGSTRYDLNRRGTRVEALVMLIRLLGEEAEAKACKDVCLFTDVPIWAQCYVAYAYGRKYANGSTVDAEKGIYLFGTGPATAEMYCTFVLRALGYTDTNGQDFTWDRSLDLARSIGIVQPDVNVKDFWRADIVAISFNTLYTKQKGLGRTLADRLNAAGVLGITKEDSAAQSATYTVQPYGKVPVILQGRKLSDSQIAALVGKDPVTVKAALSTVEDVVAWFNASPFSYMDGAWWTNNPDSYYGRYESGPDILGSRQNQIYKGSTANLGVDNVSISAAWLLQDDFVETGVIAALVSGKYPNCIAAYFKLGSEYHILDFATLIADTANRVRVKMLASLKTENLQSLSTLVQDTGNGSQIVMLGSTTALNERLHYAKYGPHAEFVLPDKVDVLYEGVKNLSLESYVIASGRNTNTLDINTFNIPSGLGGTTLTSKQASELVGKDAATIAGAVHTLPDMLLYMYAAGFGIDNGDIQLADGGVTWHFNHTAVTALAKGKANCGAMANTVRFLLDGDCDEVGYVCHTYPDGSGGGHVYNYIKSGSKYYIVDMTAYAGSNYSPGSAAILELSSLKDYGSSFRRMGSYGDSLPVIYSYQAKQEIPLAWDNNSTFTTWYPAGTVLNIISEDTANGYAIKYRTLSSGLSAEMDVARKVSTATINDMTAFKGIPAYNLPSALGRVTLTNQQVTALAGAGKTMEEVAASVRTVGDLMMYLYAAGFTRGDGDILTSGSEGQEWRCNLFADSAFRNKTPNCGAVANLAAYLLKGDYDNLGFIAHTYQYGGGGGHVYNYVKADGSYYVIDLSSYLSANYAVSGTYAVGVGSQIKNFASKYSQMYGGNTIKVIYAYSGLEELPISWSVFDDVYVTYLPASKKAEVEIILESDGYSVGFANLSAAMWEFINTKR